MSPGTWEDLDALDRAGDIQVAGRRDDHSPRTLVTIWSVVVDGALHARSAFGTEARWYRGVMRHREGFVRWGGRTRPARFTPDAARDDEIDRAYPARYGDGGRTRQVIGDAATATTLRVEPRP